MIIPNIWEKMFQITNQKWVCMGVSEIGRYTMTIWWEQQWSLELGMPYFQTDPNKCDLMWHTVKAHPVVWVSPHLQELHGLSNMGSVKNMLEYPSNTGRLIDVVNPQ